MQAVLILFSVVGIITTLLGLFFFGLRVAESITVEIKTFKYKAEKHIELRKENIEDKLVTKKERDKRFREKQDELKDIKTDQKIDKVERKILLEKDKKVIKVEKHIEKVVPKVKPKEEPKIEPIVEEVEEVLTVEE